MDLISISLDKDGQSKVRGIGLDLGCGTGLSSVPMAERGLPTIGIDASFHMLKQAVQSKPCRMLDGIVADMGKPLPFRKGVFSTVISVAAVHYLTLESS